MRAFNPDKIFPSGALCGEVGVRGGERESAPANAPASAEQAVTA
jgi:hypothetical protein